MSVSFQIEYYLDYLIVMLIFQASNSVLQFDRKLKNSRFNWTGSLHRQKPWIKKNSEVRFLMETFIFFHARDKTKNISLQLRVNAVVSFALSFAFFTFPIAYPFYITLLQPPFLSAKSTESYQYNYGYNTITYFYTLLLVYMMYLFLSS